MRHSEGIPEEHKPQGRQGEQDCSPVARGEPADNHPGRAVARMARQARQEGAARHPGKSQGTPDAASRQGCRAQQARPDDEVLPRLRVRPQGYSIERQGVHMPVLRVRLRQGCPRRSEYGLDIQQPQG